MSRSPAAWLIAVALLACVAPAAQAAPSSTAFALSGTNLLTFDPASPAATTSTPVTGVNADETLVGIDVRPQNGYLYGLGINATANTGTIYVINRRTGVTGSVGTPGGVGFVVSGSPVDFPDPATVGYGFDFNPAADRIRVTAGSLNFRVNPETGAGVDFDGSGVNGVNPDGAISSGTTTMDAAAYTNDKPNNGGISTLYGLDAASDSLYISTSPNAGTTSLVAPVTLGGSPLDFNAVTGFDIDPGVNAPASNSAVSSGIGYATLTVGGTVALYSINLVNGQATLIGSVGSGALAVQGLALQRSFDDGGQPVVALAANGTTVVRFASTAPNVATTQALGAPAAGETLVAIAHRPQTGQYYALGANDGANNATLYLLDAQTGTIAPVGSTGAIAFVDALGDPVDLPSGSAGWGMDFNPTVDRLRVTSTTGLNFRVNPNNGAPVDGNLNTTPPPSGVNPDGPINGLGVTGAAATSYTNAFTQPLTGGTTTQYTLDAATNSLFVQNPPNAGTQTAGVPLKAAGAALDFDAIAGFDIAGDVNVNPFFPAGTGEALAALRVGGTTSLYRIDLPTGAATAVGNIGAGSSAMRSLAVGDVQRPAPAASRAPDTLAFGSRDITSDALPLGTTTVTNTTSTPLAILAVSVTGDGFSVAGGTCVAGLILQKNETCQAGVSFAAATTGAKSGTLTIDTNAPDLTVALTGTGTRTLLTADLAALAFGSHDTKAAATTLGAKLTNAGTEPVTISGLSVAGTSAADFTVLAGAAGDCAAGAVLAAGQTCTARVRFAPGAAGARAATLNVTSNAAAVAVALSGTGTTTSTNPVVPAPKLTRDHKAKVSGRSLDTGLKLSCPKGRPSSCTGSVKVTRTVKRKARTVGSATFTVKAGTSLTLKVKPSKANLKLLRTARKLALKLTVAPKGAAVKTFTTTLRRGRA